MNPRNENISFTTDRKPAFLKRTAIIIAIIVAGIIFTETAPGAVSYTGLILLLAGIVGVIYPIPRIGLTTRGFSFALALVAFSLVGHSAGVEEDRNVLAALKAEDADAYLSKLREVDETQWHNVMHEIRPDEYATLIADEERQAAQAAEEARQIAEAQRLAEVEERRAAEEARLAQEEEARRAAEAQANYDAYMAAAPEREKKRKGFHCLSEWDGSHREFARAVENMMRDPDSFEHIETRVTPVQNGSHIIFMDYRARNGFGGMNVGTARGIFRNDNCEATVLTVE